MDQEIEKLKNIKDSEERGKAIRRCEYFEGSFFELYNDTKEHSKLVNWAKVDIKYKQAIYCKWIQHGKISIDYTFDKFSKVMDGVRKTIQKDHNSRFDKTIVLRYILQPVDPKEEKGNFLDIINRKAELDVENSNLKAQVNELKQSKLDLEKTNAVLSQQMQELKRLHETESETFLKLNNDLKEANENLNEKLAQSQINYQTSQENFQSFKDDCRRDHKNDDVLMQQLTSSKEKLKKVNKKFAQAKSSQSKKRKFTGEKSNIPLRTPTKIRKVCKESQNENPILYIKNKGENILRGEYHTKKCKKEMTVIKVSQKPYDKLKPDMQRERVNKAAKALKALSSGGNEHESVVEYKHFFHKILEKESSLVKDFINDPKNSQNKLNKLSAEETLTLSRCLQWNGMKLKKTKRLFKSIGLDFLASYDSVQKLKKDKLKDFHLNTGSGIFWTDTRKEETGIYYYSKVESLLDSVYKTLSEFEGEEEAKLLLHNEKIIVVFTGDKGGSFDAKGQYMKWAYYVVTKDNPQDFSHFVVYAMMTAPDTADNMRILHESYTKELEELQVKKSPNGYYIHAVLSGDFMHDYNSLGLHGASATCPSIYSTMPRSHVSYHEENPKVPHNVHNPKCIFPERTGENMFENFIESSANNPKNPRIGGKEQESVIGSSLFPLKSGGLYQQVMLPIIHIVTGLFGKLIVNFFQEIRKLDKGCEQLQVEESNTKKDIEVLETNTEKLYEKKIKIAEELIEVRDTINHLTSEEVFTIFPKGYECSAEKCKVKPNVIDAMWIGCSSPNHLTNKISEWMHAACEGMTEAQCKWYGETDAREYTCNSCRNITQESEKDRLIDKQSKLFEELKNADKDIENSLLEVKDKEKVLREEIGPTEKGVRKEMDSKNAKSEKYWNNTFNGPNTLRFLEYHSEILSCIKDDSLRDKWNNVFALLQSISKSLIRKTPLNPTEMEEFNSQIQKFSEVWFEASGSVNIAPKFDALVMHAGKIIENMNGITGAISEQSIERVHNVVNQEARVVYNISNKAEKAKHLMEILELNRSTQFSELALGIHAVPKTFTCKKCQAKISSKLQKCLTCNIEKPGLNRSLQKDFDAVSTE